MCNNAKIETVPYIEANGIDALEGARIISNIGNTNKSMIIRINSTSSYSLDIYCNATDTCKIECQSSIACESINLYCFGICLTMCNNDTGIACPLVQYGVIESWDTTLQPTHMPITPTANPTANPTSIPSVYPTSTPSTLPTLLPTISTTMANVSGTSYTTTGVHLGMSPTFETTNPTLHPTTIPSGHQTTLANTHPTYHLTGPPSSMSGSIVSSNDIEFESFEALSVNSDNKTFNPGFRNVFESKISVELKNKYVVQLLDKYYNGDDDGLISNEFNFTLDVGWSIVDQATNQQIDFDGTSSDSAAVTEYIMQNLDISDNYTYGVLTIESFYVLYASQSDSVYSTHICDVYSEEYFKSGKDYLFENWIELSLLYINGNDIIDIRASKSESVVLTANSPVTSGNCFAFPQSV